MDITEIIINAVVRFFINLTISYIIRLIEKIMTELKKKKEKT